MTGKADDEFEAMLADLERAADRASQALEGKFSDVYKQLRALSPEEIGDITPDTTDQQEYERLIALVQEATVRNMSQAQLVERIRALGETAKMIARKTNALAGLI